jgi:hypothetical protein
MLHVIALLLGGSAMPALTSAHVEGVEVTDPNTPPALLIFQSAASRYTKMDDTPLPWRALFNAAGRLRPADELAAAAPGAPHPRFEARGVAAQRTPATTQQ